MQADRPNGVTYDDGVDLVSRGRRVFVLLLRPAGIYIYVYYNMYYTLVRLLRRTVGDDFGGGAGRVVLRSGIETR